MPLQSIHPLREIPFREISFRDVHLQHAHRMWLIGLAALAFALLILGFAKPARGDQKPLPSFQRIDRTVEDYFRKLESSSSYQDGDLIPRSQIEKALEQVRRVGWTPSNLEKIEAAGLADDSFLVKQLSTPAGTKFMRQINKYPQGYDELDHLSRIPRGERMVKSLIKGPDGYKMLQYMTEAPGGHKMGKMLSDVPGGKNFNGPTGRIYTASDLRKQLRAAYDEDRSVAQTQ